MCVEILDFAKSLEGASGHTQPRAVEIVNRFHAQSVSLHHFDDMPEYVTEEELAALHELHREDVANAPPTKRSRTRDEGRVRRMTGELVFRNPYWHLGQCVVCWAAGKRRMTNKYCRECSEDKAWKFSSRRKGTFDLYKPRLCSQDCWEKFHSGQVYGLDHHMRNRRHNGARGRRTTPITRGTTPTPARTPAQRANPRTRRVLSVNFELKRICHS